MADDKKRDDEAPDEAAEERAEGLDEADEAAAEADEGSDEAAEGDDEAAEGDDEPADDDEVGGWDDADDAVATPAAAPAVRAAVAAAPAAAPPTRGGAHEPPRATPAMSSRGSGPVEGLLALFDHPDDILHAAEKVRDASFEEWDVLTPFPVHGMDDAMGIGRSWMPWVTLMLALTGLTTALTIQFGTMTFDWPIIISGKPFAAWPSFMPISFELTVLFAGVGTAIIMFLTAGLPKLKPKILHPRLTSDRFAIWISAEDDRFDAVKTREFLAGLHPIDICEIRGES